MITFLLFMLALPAVPAAQAAPGDCNDTGSVLVLRAGKQAETVTATGCASGSVQATVAVGADGALVIADEKADGAVAFTIHSPARCEVSYVWYSADVHECRGERLGANCLPLGDPVRVRLYHNIDPCPDSMDVLGLLHDHVEDVLLGESFVVPVKCKAVTDARWTFDSAAQVMFSARLTHSVALQDDSTPTLLRKRSQVGDHIYVDVVGAPTPDEIDALVTGGSRVSGVVSISATGTLVRQGPAVVPDSIAKLRASFPAMPHVNNIMCDVVHVGFMSDDVRVRDVSHVSGDLWDNGNFALDRHLALSVDEGSGPELYQFGERWSRVKGNVMHAQFGVARASVYPRKNGAAAFIEQSEIASGVVLSEWLVDPFGLSRSAARWQALGADADGYQRYQRRCNGGHEQLLVIEGGEFPVVTERRRVLLSGAVEERRLFTEFSEVTPGVLRPTLIRDETFDELGGLSHFTEYRLTGRSDVLAAEPELVLPEPLQDVWSIWVK